jgi:hypothetical protein
MCNPNNLNAQDVVFNPIYDSIFANAYAPAIGTNQLLTIRRTRVFAKSDQSFEDFGSCWLWELFYFLFC